MKPSYLLLVPILQLFMVLACGRGRAEETKYVRVPAAVTETDPKWFDRSEFCRDTGNLIDHYNDIKTPIGCQKKDIEVCYSISGALLALKNLEDACKQKPYFDVKDAYATYSKNLYPTFRSAYGQGGYGTYTEELFHRITADSLKLDQVVGS